MHDCGALNDACIGWPWGQFTGSAVRRSRIIGVHRICWGLLQHGALSVAGSDDRSHTDQISIHAPVTVDHLKLKRGEDWNGPIVGLPLAAVAVYPTSAFELPVCRLWELTGFSDEAG